MGSQCRSVRLTDSPHQPLQVSSLYSHPPKIVCNTKTISFCTSKRSSQFDNDVEMFFCSSTYTLVQSELNQLNFQSFPHFLDLPCVGVGSEENRGNFYLAENSFPSHWDPPTSITPVMKIMKIMKKIIMIIKMIITLIVIVVIISNLGL